MVAGPYVLSVRNVPSALPLGVAMTCTAIMIFLLAVAVALITEDK